MGTEPPVIDHPRVRTWLEIREPLERQLSPLGRAAIQTLGLAGGERVLDVGCGVGGTPTDLAQAVGPSGWVVGLELLPAAVEAAKRTEGLPANVSFECGDAQTFPLNPGAFDAIFSRFGIMFFAQPADALSNLRQALRPGGRMSFVCWRALSDNELDSFPLDAAAPHLPAELVSLAPNAAAFSFSDPDDLLDLMRAAGFEAIEITAHDEVVRSGDLASMVDVCSRVGALGAILREHTHLVPDATSALREALAARDGPGGPGLRASTWIVSARVD